MLFDDGSVDCVVTDPPYGMAFRSNRRVVAKQFGKITNDADASAALALLPDLYRVLKDDRHIYMFCSWHRVDEFKQNFEKYFTLKNIIVWNKNNHGTGDLKGSWAPKHEFILFGHKGRRELNKRLADVLDCPKVPSFSLTHPTEKPVSLLRTLIEVSTTPGEVVLDPFAGTGSLALACKEANRDFIGVEIDPAYADMARQRVA